MDEEVENDSTRLLWQYDAEQSAPRRSPSQRSGLNQILSNFNLQYIGPQGDEFELDDGPILGGLSKRQWSRRPLREVRRCRRTTCVSAVTKGLCATPVLILIFFGIIHILEALVGRASFFWNNRIYDPSFLDKARILHDSASSLSPHGEFRKAMVPIPCHSHNDYLRNAPLLDAIRLGCISVEADVFLFDKELYVGHRSSGLMEDRTLRSLYINPLMKMLDQTRATFNSSLNELSVFETKSAQTLVLMIDFKNSPKDTFAMVQQQLGPLREQGYLSYWDGSNLHSRAVTIVATGYAPFDLITSDDSYRDIFFDAPLDALWEKPRDPISPSDPLHEEDGIVDYGNAMAFSDISNQEQHPTNAAFYNTSTSYYASTSFASSVGFVWRGHLSPRQMQIIRGQIRGAKQRGLKARYWATPTWPTALRNHVWHVLMKEGADVLDVDDLEAAVMQDWTKPVHDDSLLW